MRGFNVCEILPASLYFVMTICVNLWIKFLYISWPYILTWFWVSDGNKKGISVKFHIGWINNNLWSSEYKIKNIDNEHTLNRPFIMFFVPIICKFGRVAVFLIDMYGKIMKNKCEKLELIVYVTSSSYVMERCNIYSIYLSKNYVMRILIEFTHQNILKFSIFLLKRLKITTANKTNRIIVLVFA